MKPRALIAMSGGVDSSVSAHLVREAGYDIEGATMLLQYSGDIDVPRLSDSGTEGDFEAFPVASVRDAHRVTAALGINFHVLDMREPFRKDVIESFVSDYENGRTPNPCVICNRRLKFGKFLDYALTHGFDYMVTGHYAIIERHEETGRYLLRKALSLAKDQSYFLYSLTQEQLAHTIFPLGRMDKQDTREVARSLGLPVAGKKESQDICFIPGGAYADFIESYVGHKYPPGDFVYADGTVLGEHKGIINYTIGQRKGLGLSLKKPAYVTALDTVNNRVILGGNEDLFTTELDATDCNWISLDNPTEPFRAAARIRYRNKEAPALITPTGDNTFHVTFDVPQRAITRGQSVVIYDGDYVVGGGRIV